MADFDLAHISRAAQQLGFSRVAALNVQSVASEFRDFYEKYLQGGSHADLKYLTRPQRYDLRSIEDSAETLLIFLYPYRFRSVEAKLRAAPKKVARYAWQEDYHDVLRAKLSSLLQDLNLSGRAVTDSAPLFERYWARRAGLGFIGRNGMLIDRQSGSYFFIAAALVKERVATASTLLPREENPQGDFADFCKDCRLCIDACPTSALLGDGLMDTQKCISYRTIESKQEAGSFPAPGKKHNWVFGCDICQQVCPYNKQASAFADEAFNREHPAAMLVAGGEVLSSRAVLKGSVFFRRGIEKLNAQRAK